MTPVKLKQRQTTIKLGGDVEMVFCFIPKGEFRMGSRYGEPREQPVHRVIIPEGFWLAQTPVTQAQYQRFDSDHRSQFHGEGHGKYPVENVTWHQARAFCQWLKRLSRPEKLAHFEPGLPTEAQWEYACRAGTETDYSTGDGELALARAGWFGEMGWGETHPVKEKAANAFGLYDMHGNVWEWCRDEWSQHAFRFHARQRIECLQPAQTVSEDDYYGPRVLRGGAWISLPGDCRSAFRLVVGPGSGLHFEGFRVGLFPVPSCPGPEPK